MLAIISTHPIQYQTPIWQALAADGRVPFEVWYLTDFGARPSHDAEFGATFRWDIETLSGYPHRLLTVAKGATPTDFWKCRLTERLRERLRKANAKAVWIQGWQVAGYWQAVHEARAAGAKVWIRAESNDLAPISWRKLAVKKPLLGYLFSHIDRFLYIGEANKRLYRKFGVPDGKLFPARYAVDNERFAKQANELRPLREEIRHSWGISENAFCVMFCGKFIPKKRPIDLVKAAQLVTLEKAAANIHLLFTGSGELGDALRSACDVVYDKDGPNRDRAGGASEHVAGRPRASFTGFLNQTEISRAYVAADCLVLPSDYGETWGLVVNEAMASGLPCIVSDSCGCAEDLVQEKWTYPCGDISELKHRLLMLRHVQKNLDFAAPPTFFQTISAVENCYRELQKRQ